MRDARSTPSATRSSAARPATSSAALPLPATVPRRARARPTSSRDVRGHRVRRQGPAQVDCTSRTFPLPELAPDEAYVAVMASLDQLQHGVDVDLRAAADVRVPRAPRQGERVGRAPRPAVPRGRLRRRRAWCCASARRCATGSRATGSPCTATTSTTRTRRAHDDSMLATNQRIWGFETNFGGLADLARREGQPADAEARAPHVGGGRGQRAVQLHELPHARRASNGAQMKQGDAVLVWGATGGIGGYAVQYVLNGGGTPVGVVSLAREGRAAARAGRARRSSTARPRATSSGTTSTRRTRASGAASARTIRELVGRRPRHRVRAPRPLRRWARRCSSPSAAARSSRARRRSAT